MKRKNSQRRELVVEKWKIRHVGEAPARFERLRLHVKPADARGAGGRLHQAGENFQRGGFAGGVGSEHGKKFPARNGQRHVVDRDEVAEFFDEMDEFDHGVLQGLPSWSSEAVTPPGSSTRKISPSVLT